MKDAEEQGRDFQFQQFGVVPLQIGTESTLGVPEMMIGSYGEAD